MHSLKHTPHFCQRCWRAMLVGQCWSDSSVTFIYNIASYIYICTFKLKRKYYCIHRLFLDSYSRTETKQHKALALGLCKFTSVYRKNAEIILCTYFNNCICLYILDQSSRLLRLWVNISHLVWSKSTGMSKSLLVSCSVSTVIITGSCLVLDICSFHIHYTDWFWSRTRC